MAPVLRLQGRLGGQAPDFCCEEPKLLRWKIPETKEGGFPGGAVVTNLPANAGDTGSSPGLGRSHMPRSN